MHKFSKAGRYVWRHRVSRTAHKRQISTTSLTLYVNVHRVCYAFNNASTHYLPLNVTAFIRSLLLLLMHFYLHLHSVSIFSNTHLPVLGKFYTFTYLRLHTRMYVDRDAFRLHSCTCIFSCINLRAFANV